MKYSAIMERRGAATVEEAERIVGGCGMLRSLRRAGWLKPKVQVSRLTLFDYDDCLSAWKRVCAEGLDSLRAAAEMPPQSRSH